MDFNSNKPIYKQIIDYSFGQILTGMWAAGERVPSVRELSVQLSVKTEGIIVPKRGMGFYLTADALEHVNDVRRKEFFETSLKELFKEMRLLDIPIEEIVKRYKESED